MQELLNFVFAAGLIVLFLNNRALKQRLDELARRLSPPEQRIKSETPFKNSGEKINTEPSVPSHAVPTLEQLAAAASSPDRPTAPSRVNADLEQFIGGNLFSKLGVLALLVGAGLFLAYAFEQNLISETVRCAIGFGAGFVSLGIAHLTHRKQLPVLAQALVALGVSVLYLTVYAMSQFYGIIPTSVATALMVIVCALTIGLSLYYTSEPIALMAAAGAYLTPVLIGDGSSSIIPLLAYLLVIGISVTFLVWLRPQWAWLRPAPVLGTLLLTGSWYIMRSVYHLEVEVLFCAVLWLLFLGYDVLHRVVYPDRARMSDPWVSMLTAAFVFFCMAVFSDHAGSFGTSAMGGIVAVVYGALLFTAHDRLSKPGGFLWIWQIIMVAGVTFGVFGTFSGYEGAAVFFSVAMLFHGISQWQKVTASAAGTFLFLTTGGFILMIAAYDTPDFDLFLANTRSLSYVFAALLWLWLGLNPSTEGILGKRISRSVCGMIAVVLGFVWLNLELDGAFDRWMPYTAESTVRRSNWIELARSGIWMMYALVLFAVGFLRNISAPRYAAILLFGFTMFKVFVSDLSFLDTPYRIISFIVLGVMLILVSFVYQRYRDLIFGTQQNSETSRDNSRISE